MIKYVIVALIAMVTIVGAWTVTEKNKRDKSITQSDTIFTKKFYNVIQIENHPSGIVPGPCMPADVTFTLTKDTVFLASGNRPPLAYSIQALRGDGGLVCLRPDSAVVVFYKYKDKRDTLKRIILMEQEHISILLFESKECPATAR